MSGRLRCAVTLALFALALSAAPASAQQLESTFNNPWASTAPAREAVAPAPQAKAPGEYTFRVFGGILTGYGDLGIAGGAGLGTRPFENEKLEVTADVLLGRTSQTFEFDTTAYTTTVFAGSANLLYHFPTTQPFAPFAGGGLVISRASFKASSQFFDETIDYGIHGTFMSLQVLGGLERQFGQGKAFRAEARFGVASFGGSAVLLAGITF